MLVKPNWNISAVEKNVLTNCILSGVDALFFHIDITMLIDMASSRYAPVLFFRWSEIQVKKNHVDCQLLQVLPCRCRAVPKPCRVEAVLPPCRWSWCPGAGVEVTLSASKRSRRAAPAGWWPARSASLVGALLLLGGRFAVCELDLQPTSSD